MNGEDFKLIYAEPLGTRESTTSCDQWRGLKLFTVDGDVLTIWRTDNKCSDEIKSYCSKHDITLELAPPRNHRTSKAERAIRTFKNHLLSMIATADNK